MKTLLLALLLLSSTAMSFEFDIGIGQSIYSRPENGIWYQNGFENDFKMQTVSASFGINDYIYENLKYRAGYMNLGNVSSYALAVARDDNYNGVDGCIGPCLPLSHFYGTGKVEGLYATLQPQYKINSVTLFLEGGLWLYRPTFSMIVPDARSCAVGCDYYVHNESENDLYIGPVFGFGARYKNIEIAVTFWRVDSYGTDEKKIPIYQSLTNNISIRSLF